MLWPAGVRRGFSGVDTQGLVTSRYSAPGAPFSGSLLSRPPSWLRASHFASKSLKCVVRPPFSGLWPHIKIQSFYPYHLSPSVFLAFPSSRSLPHISFVTPRQVALLYTMPTAIPHFKHVNRLLAMLVETPCDTSPGSL